MITGFDLLVTSVATASGVMVFTTGPIVGSMYRNPAVAFLGAVVPLILGIIFLIINAGWSGFFWGLGAMFIGGPVLGKLSFSGFLIFLPIPLFILHFFK